MTDSLSQNKLHVSNSDGMYAHVFLYSLFDKIRHDYRGGGCTPPEKCLKCHDFVTGKHNFDNIFEEAKSISVKSVRYPDLEYYLSDSRKKVSD